MKTGKLMILLFRLSLICVVISYSLDNSYIDLLVLLLAWGSPSKAKYSSYLNSTHTTRHLNRVYMCIIIISQAPQRLERFFSWLNSSTSLSFSLSSPSLAAKGFVIWEGRGAAKRGPCAFGALGTNAWLLSFSELAVYNYSSGFGTKAETFKLKLVWYPPT